MTITSTPLPNDVEALKELLVNREALIAKLLAEIARLKRWQFGRSSERLATTLAQLQGDARHQGNLADHLTVDPVTAASYDRHAAQA